MNKRKIIAIIVSILAFCSLVFMFYIIAVESSRRKAIAEKLQTIPYFVFYQLCGTSFTQDCLSGQQPTLLIYFSSDCDFCIHKTRSIAEHLSDFKDKQLLFISLKSVEVIQAFAENKGLLHQPNVLFLQDRNRIFPDQFRVRSVPHSLVYDKNGDLIARFSGQVLARTIVRAMQE